MLSLLLLAFSAWCFWLWGHRRRARRRAREYALLQQARAQRIELIITVKLGNH